MRVNAVIVDEAGKIKETVTGLKMLFDIVDVEYISGQSINNGCFSTVSKALSDDGDGRVFIIEKASDRRVNMWQLKNPKTYEELKTVTDFVNKFNG